jgi:cyanophycinase
VSPAQVPSGETRGWIVPIGGNEAKDDHPLILQRFVQLCGGRDARIGVIPTASQLAETGPRYKTLFTDLGAAEIVVMDFDTRRDCDEPGRLADLERCDGIFLTGGNQLRLSTLLGGTAVARTLRSLNASGVSVAGTSAGAAFLCEHMIAFGTEGASPQAGGVTLAPGLGLTNRVIIDQHFRQRDRLGRLLSALAYNPFAIGLGLDEDAAAFIGPDDVVEVEGSGSVTVLDCASVKFSSMDRVQEHEPVALLGVQLHILARGTVFNLRTREASTGALAVSKT